jgi:hypothetical protein
MSNLVLDQTGDLNGQELYRLTRVHPLPPFVKEASSDEVIGPPEGLEPHCYAFRRGNNYPCHTSAATYVSTMFFLDKKAEWDRPTADVIEQYLDHFARYHGIVDRISQLKQAFAKAKELPAEDKLPLDDYALVVDGVGHFTLRNPSEVRKCAEYIKEYRDDLPYTYRQEMASKVLEKAAHYGVALGDMDEFLDKQAGKGACPAQTVAEFLFERSVLYKRAGFLDYAIKAAELAKACLQHKGGVHDQDQLVKLACLVDQVDRETRLKTLATDLPAPEDVFFQLTAKAASQLRHEHVSLTSGNIYKAADLERVKLDAVADVMGEDFAQAISAGGLFVDQTKMAEIIPTLPRGDAELFDRMLYSMGIHPVVKEAAHEKGGFYTAELQALAQLHNPG